MFVCSVTGAVPGQLTVSGDEYLEAAFQYSYSHLWRNLGILLGFYVFFLSSYLVVSEINSSTSSTAEVLLFKRRSKHLHSHQLKDPAKNQISSGVDMSENGETRQNSSARHKSIFTWTDVTYDIHIKDEPRRLLDNVCGWTKPGTLTALMVCVPWH